jgi:hypothetical protein
MDYASVDRRATALNQNLKRMRMTSKPAPNFFTLLVIVLSMSSMVSCAAFGSAPTPTTTPIPTATVTLTPKPSPTATSTPTDLELLDERTRFLFREPASNVINFFLEIQDCVRTDNKEKLATLIHYPITIYVIDNETEIQNAAEFIANYEKIITPKWKDEVLAQEPATLFVNWQGVMVHRGKIWFAPICLDETCQNKNFYVLTINTRAANMD